ncbi:hypothetical protein ABPG74_000666 [Tetrahymena malaccensis]
MSDSEDLDELEQNQDVQNISVFRKREKINANDDKLIDMDPLKKLNYMLTCPICLDIFQEPVYVKGCSHRFCKECIEKAIRSSKMKQCPTCRKIIGTKRLLRVDFNVQEIINLIYGDVTKFLELKQSNDELLIQKTYSQLANSDGTTRKRRRQFNSSTTEKAQDNQQSSPTFSSTKEEKGVASNSAYKNSSNQQDQNSNFSSVVKRRLTSNSNNQGSNQQTQGQKNNEKGAQSSNEQSSTRKRKFDNLGESGNKKGDELYTSGHVLQKKKYFEEEIKEKQVEDSLRKNQQESSLTSINGASLLNIGLSSSKADRSFINIQVKVIPYDKLQKQFDFSIVKIDWTLSLDDVTKLICQKLNINYQKFKPYIKFYVKSSVEESTYHPLEDKTQIIKNIDDQFWSVDSKQKYIRPYNKDEQAKNITNDYIHQKAAQNRILFYIIEHKDVSYTN